MKNIKAISLILLLSFFSASMILGQTTETEYNYLIKGYKIQQESGLDMKKGYTIVEEGNWGKIYSNFQRLATFYSLFRDGEKRPCAMLVVFERTDTDFEQYLCIPHYKSSVNIWNKAEKAWASSEISSAYGWGLVKFISFQFSLTDKEKQEERDMVDVVRSLEEGF